MKAISLTNGGILKVDDEDYALLVRHNWHWNDPNASGTRYAYTKMGKKRVSAHEMVIGGIAGMIIHHKDHDGLNCQKENLCHASHAENNRHRKMSKSNKSGFKGVYEHSKRWKAVIQHNSQKHSLGVFDNPREAAMAYDRKALELYGDFALSNEQLGLIKQS